MRGVEASTRFPIGQEESWDFIFGDQGRRVAELSALVAAVEGYQIRPDGTPCYTMVLKMGPLTMRSVSDYVVFDRPRRSVNKVLGSPLGGEFTMSFEPVGSGTTVVQRWDVRPHGALMRLMLPVIRPILRRSLQRDLDRWALAAG